MHLFTENNEKYKSAIIIILTNRFIENENMSHEHYYHKIQDEKFTLNESLRSIFNVQTNHCPESNIKYMRDNVRDTIAAGYPLETH